MVSRRALDVLRVIVEDYVASREPVGSKSIVERHVFGVSAATIRNDMAALEDANLIHAPHTSAGRVPTDLGYRTFVDGLHDVKPLTRVQLNAIERFLDESLDLDDFLSRTVRLLSNLTNQVAMVQYPVLGKETVAHLELLPSGARKVMVVLITTAGRVDKTVLELASDIDDSTVSDLRARINSAIQGTDLAAAPAALDELANTVAPDVAAVIHKVREALAGQIEAQRSDRLIVAGTPQLVRAEGDFSRSIAPVMDAIEEQVILLKLFGEMGRDDDRGVRIGRELSDELSDTAIVSAAYTATGGDTARIAVLGPTRMNYSLNMAAVEAVARYVSTVLGDEA
ncbi:MAG: heat-inducible transcriptional repressor HrcA [Microbacteriaceae bacterium]